MERQKKQDTTVGLRVRLEGIRGRVPRKIYEALVSDMESVLVAASLALGPDPTRRAAWRRIRNQREIVLSERIACYE